MATAAAALLDELMGKNRNALPDENFSGIKWSDAEVCKHYLVDFCPNELFVNTRSDLGQCEKIHDDHMKKEYKESSRFQHMGYEEEFMQYLQQIMNDVEKRIKRGHSRLALNSNRPNLTAPSRGADEEQIRILTDRINSLVEQVEQLGCEGKVDEAQNIMKLCDKLTNERAELQAASEEALDTILSQEKQMEVCEVCGAFLIVGDSQTRVDDHLMGKQHMGFAKIKATIEEIKNKKNQEISDREEKIRKEREEREKEREKEREERRNREKEKEKQREREREERRKERERQRERERSRSRDGHGSRSHNRRRSRSPDRRRSRSRDRRRSRSHDHHRSRSRDRRRSRSRDRCRSRSRDHRSRSRDHRSGSRDRHRSKSHGRHRSRSQDRKRSKSHEQRRSRSHDGRRSKSHDRDHHRDRSHSRDLKHGSKKSFDKSSRREETRDKSEKRSDDKSHQKVHDRNHEDTKRHHSHSKEMADKHHGGSNNVDKQKSMSPSNRYMEREQNEEDYENHPVEEHEYMKGDATDSNRCPGGATLSDEDMKDKRAERAEMGAAQERRDVIKPPDETSS